MSDPDHLVLDPNLLTWVNAHVIKQPKQANICPRCEQFCHMTIHHVLPHRFFQNVFNNPLQPLCRKCHDLIEILIPREEKREPIYYINLVYFFLQASEVSIPKSSQNPSTTRRRLLYWCQRCKCIQRARIQCHRCVVGEVKPAPTLPLEILAAIAKQESYSIAA